MKLYSYVVARDYGFAPNPFYGFCTLATCKPIIRRSANADDWVIGTGSAATERKGYLVFAMRVTEALTFSDYWTDTRFQQKKPYLLGSKKQAFGDNIYVRESKSGRWLQENSHHSLSDGKPNEANVAHDTQTNRVLISADYFYWGGSGPKLAVKVASQFCKRGPGHKIISDAPAIASFIAWVRSQGPAGFCGQPLDWSKSP